MHMNESDSPGRKIYLLCGMGGIGKTQITLKYIDESSDSYSYIFWIDATSEVTIDQSLKDIYKTNIKILPSGVSYSAAMIQQWINTLNDEWLMIFDNADGSPDTVEKYIPPGNKGHILITSRNPEHKRVVSASNSEEVLVMNEATAVELLLKSSGLNESPEKYYNVATEICAKFHFLPLAIDQAGAYINTGQCNIDEYISVYDKNRLRLMTNKKFKGASKYNKTVYGTWEISFQKIEEMAKDVEDEECAMTAKYAIQLINMTAFVHHENISDEMFERAAKYYADHVKDIRTV
ncbi:P-loop containing nucleoside triphosphate hydrolase protein [Cyathus striatus]|nr:P-loop containing nucleoside triphosphate hydrolase protein [Cyathus striatus]